MNDVSFSYGKRRVLEKVNLHIARRDRIAVVGKNGSGKTTLLKLLTGELAPGSGTVTRNPQLKIGQFFQELENLHPDRTILDEILSLPEMKSAEARTILACFLFRRDTVYKKIRDLSMGEKCRVAFVKLYFSSANLLVLDEPVNYFDIPDRERVEEALEQFPGSIVLVAHDPYLLRKVSNKVVHIENGKAAVFSGGYAEWENRRSLSPSVQILANEWERLKLQYEQLITQESGDPEEEEERMKQLKRIQREMKQLRKTMDDAGS
ncbi:ATP-binding cassette domain-containing protein [Caldibacillus debilis]|uniref:ATP-binding cassette domain-containing protein n=1 Tax=Caldibacillus debilis TaxID=301148 RepID=UPI000376666B|nr:ATP-binding cassette domain-containing protein [Caldibacillus debilis]